MFRNANEAIDWIHGARYKGLKNGLENTKALLKALGDPQDSFRCIHIAGTNGKGSTAAFCERILREAGFTAGLYTSPYLIRYNERVQVCGLPIPDDELVDIMNHIAGKVEELLKQEIYPTTFELGTALAFEFFRRRGVEYAVVEVGLGGRFDSTNVITPEISLIAAIGLDHVKVLGDTVEQIAFEKAGIIKNGVPVIVQTQAENILDVFREAANERGCELTVAEMPETVEQNAHGASFVIDETHYETALCGKYQLLNASLAINGMKKLGIAADAIVRGVKKAKWPCRLEWVNGALIDGAHNPQGAQALRDYLEKFFKDENITLVTGMMHDKSMQEVAEILAPVCDKVIATCVENEPRAASPEELAEIYNDLGAKTICIDGITKAVDEAMSLDGIKVFAGSLYIAGAVREHLAGADCFSENLRGAKYGISSSAGIAL